MSTKRGPAGRWTHGTALAIAVVATASVTAGCDRAPHDDGLASSSPATANVTAPAAAALVGAPRPGFVRLARSAHPLARPELDEGRVEPGRRLANVSVFFKLSPEQRRERDALAAAQLDRTSPLYHQWLTPETYRARFGAKPEDVARASSWLAAQGLNVYRTSPLGTRVTFSATVAELEAAFQTEMHYYRVAGEKHYAMATAPAIPEDLADVVLSVYNTHDFVPKPASRRVNAGAAARRAEVSGHYQLTYDAGPDASGIFDLLGPPDWATAYDVSKLYSPGIGGKALDGTGVTIGIVGTAPIAQSDIDAFRATFNLPATTVKMTLVPGTGAPSTSGFGGGVEAILDVEWSGGIAKGATVNYVYVGADDSNVDDATTYLIEENLAPVISESYGGCEAGILPTDADITEMNGTAANLMGITYMAAAGDDGAADCGAFGDQVQTGLYVDVPGAFPGVTSVGGTQFPSPLWSAQGNLLDAGLEQVWNEGNDPYSNFGIGAGGGGISSLFTRPAYQSSAATCTPVGSLPTPSSGPMRQVPDVALSAASETPGLFIECTFQQGKHGGEDCSGTGGSPEGTVIGGTSASSPSFAGVVAILNQATGERLGNINPMLYELAASSSGSSVFHDIVSGNNEVACGPGGTDAGDPPGGDWPDDAGCGDGGLYGYAAIPGYDCASGNGSIDAYNLVSAWLGATPTKTALVPSPTIAAEGEDVTLTATVDVEGTNSNPVGGVVTFTFQSYATDCSNDLSWELGTTTITNGTATSGTAVLQTTVPPGLVMAGRQKVDLVAVYGGDTHHLASQSAKVGLTFQPVTFAVAPATLSTTPNANATLATTGGMTPVRWFIAVDTTETFSKGNFGYSTIDESSGAFTAGPSDGYVLIEALDKYGAEAIGEVTVGAPDAAPPWVVPDGGASFCQVDAGADAGADAGPNDAGAVDAAALDGGTTTLEAGGGGCNCEAAGRGTGPSGAALTALVGMALVVARRRRPSRDA